MTAIKDDPSDKAAYHHLAVARERKGDVEGAIAACRLGLERAENDAYLRKRLFLLLVKNEAFGQALEWYETLNGNKEDVDALSGRFFLSCRALDGGRDAVILQAPPGKTFDRASRFSTKHLTRPAKGLRPQRNE